MIKFAFVLLAISCSIFMLSAQPHILPIAGAGKCKAGTPYTVNSIEYLKTNIADLECIFAAGLAPDKIGLGFNYGTVLLGENSIVPQPFASPFYQGDYVVKTTCKQKTVHMGILKVAGFSVATAPWTIAPFTEEMLPGEAPIDPTVNNIIMDFRQNVHDICPIEDETGALNSKGFLPFKNSLPPVNCFVDIVRVVGRDEHDGAIILLAKGMNKDPATGWQTSLFYALKNFDPAVKPTMKIGTAIMSPTSFDYLHNGFLETFPRFGATGLIPFLINAKRTILTALTSNPLVAALVLKERGWAPMEGLVPFPWSEELFLGEMGRGSLLGGLGLDTLVPAKQTEEFQTNQDQQHLDETPVSIWNGLTNVDDEIVSDLLYRGLQQYFDLMKVISMLEDARVSQTATEDNITNNLRPV